MLRYPFPLSFLLLLPSNFRLWVGKEVGFFGFGIASVHSFQFLYIFGTSLLSMSELLSFLSRMAASGPTFSLSSQKDFLFHLGMVWEP